MSSDCIDVCTLVCKRLEILGFDLGNDDDHMQIIDALAQVEFVRQAPDRRTYYNYSDLQRLYELGADFGLRCSQCDNDADFEPDLTPGSEYAWICGVCGWKISRKAAARMIKGGTDA